MQLLISCGCHVTTMWSTIYNSSSQLLFPFVQFLFHAEDTNSTRNQNRSGAGDLHQQRYRGVVTPVCCVVTSMTTQMLYTEGFCCYGFHPEMQPMCLEQRGRVLLPMQNNTSRPRPWCWLLYVVFFVSRATIWDGATGTQWASLWRNSVQGSNLIPTLRILVIAQYPTSHHTLLHHSHPPSQNIRMSNPRMSNSSHYCAAKPTTIYLLCLGQQTRPFLLAGSGHVKQLKNSQRTRGPGWGSSHPHTPSTSYCTLLLPHSGIISTTPGVIL